MIVAVSALVAAGALRGLWATNLHNGVLAVGFGVAGAWVLAQRPGQREARLFLALGLLSAVIFAGRQVGLSSADPADAWWGWLGVWPTALALALTTWVILCFPEGRFLSKRWRLFALVGASLAGVVALGSALWPVEYERTSVTTPFPFALGGADVVSVGWPYLAYSTYPALQVLWLVGLVARWRSSDSAVRQQLTVLLLVVAVDLVLLFAGLAFADSATAGTLGAVLLPFAAGWLLNRHSLAHVLEIEGRTGRLAGLSPRENDVLELMAQGLSNAAIASRLHLSIKTVEPAIRAIFRKLDLQDDPDSNRRVLAVTEFWSRDG